jgi:hypothetical protein
MQTRQRSSPPLTSLMVAATFLFMIATAWAASKEKVVHTFTGGKDGDQPLTGLVSDSSGNLYGTVGNNGGYAAGLVFELSPTSDGKWKEQALYTFTGGTDGGCNSSCSDLIFDSAGNLYGTAGGGNLNCGDYGAGCGVVFELSPLSNGKWKERVLYTFNNQADGGFPGFGLVLDSHGNLYGTATSGGNLSRCHNSGCGVVFELTPAAKGKWNYKVRYAFSGGKDGANPLSSLILDSTGNLYGTAPYGGHFSKDCRANDSFGCGLVFELTPDSKSKWTERVLYAFRDPAHGAFPSDHLVFDGEGNLYGSAGDVVFELTPTASGQWSEKVLHYFGGTGGVGPAGLVFDRRGNLYSTTIYGGDLNCFGGYGCGVVFELTPSSDGSWKERVLYAFKDAHDGGMPRAGVTIDPRDNLCGTTQWGGIDGAGVAFEINLPAP